MRVVIDGAGEIGSHLAKLFASSGNQVVVIDDDDLRLEPLGSALDVETISGDRTSIAVFRQARVPRADLFISVLPSVAQELNVVAAGIAKRLGAARAVARVSSQEYLTAESRALFKELGVDFIFCPERFAADEIVEQLSHGGTTDSVAFADGKLRIATFRVTEDSPLLDIRLLEFALNFSHDTNLRVIAISRDGQTIIPGPDSRFKFADLVYFVVTHDSYMPLCEYLGIRNVDIRRVMIMGGGSVGEMVAQSIYKNVSEVKIIDMNRERCVYLDSVLPEGVLIVNGDARNSDTLFEEGIKGFDAFVATSGSDEANILACVAAKKFGVPHTVAQVENLEYMKLSEDMGIDNVVNKKLSTAGRVYQHILGDKTQYVRYLSGTDAEVVEYTVSPGSAITKDCLSRISFPSGAVIGGVIRGSEALIASGSTKIEPYDKVAVFAMPDSIKTIDKFFK